MNSFISCDNTFVLEAFKTDTCLMMSLYPYRDASSTVRHYAESPVNLADVNRLTQEVIALLNTADPKGKVSGDHYRSLVKAGQLLWDVLIARQFKAQLASSNTNLVLFIDEELIAIPWEMLHDGSEFLCLRHNLGRLVRAKGEQSASVAAARDVSSEPLRMLVLADPTDELHAAYEEGLHIKNHFEHTRRSVRIDFKSSSIDRLYVKKNIRDYDIVHFAGHCEYDAADRYNTGWLLTDGRFTAQDILAMSSSGNLPALVFSNACQSAHAPLDTVEPDCHCKNYSLAAAFIFAGVRHYIGPVRKIEDAISFLFARVFYEYAASGFSVGESVRQSRLRIIRDYGRETILWAGYVSYGNPTAVLLKKRANGADPASGNIKLSRRQRVIVLTGAACCATVFFLWMFLAAPTARPDAYILYVRAQRYFAGGNNDAALKSAQMVLSKDPMFLAVYPLIADTYQRLGNKELALKYYYDYCMYSQKKGDHRNRASAYSGLGWTYHTAGNYAKAHEFYAKAIELSRQTRDKLNEAIAMRRLAVLMTDEKKYDAALELLTKSAEINRERARTYEYRYNLACDYFDIGLVFANKDDYAAAREFYTKSRELFEQLKCRRELSDCYFNLGELYVYEKAYQKALDYYLRGLAIDQGQNNKFGLVTDYSMIGELYVEMENYAQAEKYFRDSADLASTIGATPDEAYSLYQLGLVYKKTRKSPQARELFQRAQKLYDGIDQGKREEVRKELAELEK